MRQLCRENKDEIKPYGKSKETTLQRKQGRETTLSFQVTPGLQISGL
jgi:hypothetical protein